MPKRGFTEVEEFEEALREEEEVLIDGFELRVDRPKDADNQSLEYSGKKKCHTNSVLVLSNGDRWIYYVSEVHKGSANDYGMLKSEFPPEKDWFANKKVIVDLGFIGIDKDYMLGGLMIGHKKPRKSRKDPEPKLTAEQKEWNKNVSRKRIYVEHAIGGIRRYRIIYTKCRLKNKTLKNRIIGVCAGLWNYKLKFCTNT